MSALLSHWLNGRYMRTAINLDHFVLSQILETEEFEQSLVDYGSTKLTNEVAMSDLYLIPLKPIAYFDNSSIGNTRQYICSRN